MTQEIFLQLLKDTSKGEGVFDRFLQKNHTIFEQTIGITFSGDKYSDIDIKGIYYRNFMAFTIGQLEQSKQVTPFNEWVTKLAVDRVSYIRSDVNKCLVKSFLEKGGREHWDSACELIRKEYSSVIKGVVSKNFDNIKYHGYYEDILGSFFTIFYLDRVEKPNPINKIEDLDSYLFRMLDNLAKKKKTHDLIDKELGLDHGDVEFDKHDKSDEKESEIIEIDMSPKGFVSMVDAFLTEQGDCNNDKEWAEQEIEKLLALMPKPKKDTGKSSEADLIRKVMLWDCDYEELAIEENDSVGYLYTRVNRAMFTLMKVSLPYIKAKCKKIFTQNSCYLNDKYQSTILEEFFFTNKSLSCMALLHGKSMPEYIKDLVNAFKKVKKLNQENIKEYPLDSDVEIYLEEEVRQDAKTTMKIYRSNLNK